MYDRDLGRALLQAARLHAERPALWAAGERFTYRALFDEAARIAAGLKEAGAAPGEVVAVLSHRTLTAYAGILASLLCGCTYMPLNPAYRPERNRLMLEASGARVLIADARCADRLDALLAGAPGGITLILPEPGRSAASASDPARPRITAGQMAAVDFTGVEPPKVDRDQAVYLLFTSGSTGKPKGVPISHGNLAAYLSSILGLAPHTPQDRVLQLVDLTFDLSAHDMFVAWISGAELYSLPEDAGPLAPRLIAQHGLTSCMQGPAAAAANVRQRLIGPGRLPSLRITFFAGEALADTVARAWSAAAPASRIFNVYGPTEATIVITHHEFHAHDATNLPIVPIGVPFEGQYAALFDTDLTPTPEGEIGEIFLSGSQVTVGYWRSPELDATRFVEAQGRRWYRTGDLGRWQAPHGIVFTGRADRQVKIRGYMVQLQEVEAVLRRAAGKDEVAVIAWPTLGLGGAEGSVGFVRGEPADAAEVRAACRAIAEDYMSPDRIVFLPELPLNANGKVDYQALVSHPALGA